MSLNQTLQFLFGTIILITNSTLCILYDFNKCSKHQRLLQYAFMNKTFAIEILYQILKENLTDHRNYSSYPNCFLLANRTAWTASNIINSIRVPCPFVSQKFLFNSFWMTINEKPVEILQPMES